MPKEVFVFDVHRAWVPHSTHHVMEYPAIPAP
jgi:hypothetical protein